MPPSPSLSRISKWPIVCPIIYLGLNDDNDSTGAYLGSTGSWFRITEDALAPNQDAVWLSRPAVLDYSSTPAMSGSVKLTWFCPYGRLLGESHPDPPKDAKPAVGGRRP